MGVTYKTVFDRIVSEADQMIGEVTIAQARQIEGVKIKGDKEIEGEVSRKEIEKLLEKYSDVMGEGSVAVARKAVKELYQEDKSVKDLDLPEKILPKEVKADQFASAL